MSLLPTPIPIESDKFYHFKLDHVWPFQFVWSFWSKKVINEIEMNSFSLNSFCQNWRISYIMTLSVLCVVGIIIINNIQTGHFYMLNPIYMFYLYVYSYSYSSSDLRGMFTKSQLCHCSKSSGKRSICFVNRQKF